uniref:Uncharacterized protein n=1 Tax=Arundo donax TaxID=35708 RepID=A0A0A8Y3P6_ARUDO
MPSASHASTSHCDRPRSANVAGNAAAAASSWPFSVTMVGAAASESPWSTSTVAGSGLRGSGSVWTSGSGLSLGLSLVLLEKWRKGCASPSTSMLWRPEPRRESSAGEWRRKRQAGARAGQEAARGCEG